MAGQARSGNYLTSSLAAVPAAEPVLVPFASFQTVGWAVVAAELELAELVELVELVELAELAEKKRLRLASVRLVDSWSDFLALLLVSKSKMLPFKAN